MRRTVATAATMVVLLSGGVAGTLVNASPAAAAQASDGIITLARADRDGHRGNHRKHRGDHRKHRDHGEDRRDHHRRGH